MTSEDDWCLPAYHAAVQWPHMAPLVQIASHRPGEDLALAAGKLEQ